MADMPPAAEWLAEPRLLWWSPPERSGPQAAAVFFRARRYRRSAVLLGTTPAVLLFVGEDARPTGLFLAGAPSARATLEILRILAQGCAPAAEVPAILPLDAPPPAWAAILAALGRMCARLPPLPDGHLTLPPLAA